MDFSDLFVFEPELAAVPASLTYPESAHALLEESELPYICGGPNARLLSAPAFPPAKALRDAANLIPGVYPAFHGGIYNTSPFFAGTASAALGLAKVLSMGLALADAKYALSFAGRPDENALQAAAGARAVLDGMGLPLSGLTYAFHTKSETELPPVVFLACAEKAPVLPAQFQQAGSTVSLFLCPFAENGLPIAPVMASVFAQVESLVKQGRIRSAYALSAGGLAEAVALMTKKSGLGFAMKPELDVFSIGTLRFGSILAESDGPLPGAVPVGQITAEPVIRLPRCQPLPIEKIFF